MAYPQSYFQVTRLSSTSYYHHFGQIEDYADSMGKFGILLDTTSEAAVPASDILP